MKLDFGKMDIASPQFNFVRALMVAPTGGADVGECLKAAALIRDSDDESWISEWTKLAEHARVTGEKALQAGQPVAARRALMRASNYYRSAMFSMPSTDERLEKYITLSRETFRKAAGLFSPPIEAVDIPFDGARLPGYFLTAGTEARPTLLLINGGDSTSEELVHWIGFAAQAQDWNCLVFEGPGQWSALQMNPGLHMRADYEVPVKAVLDYLVGRKDVDPTRIALTGYSLSTQFVPRVVASDDRVCAAVCVGGIVVDVVEAWSAVMPAALRNALPSLFDVVFAVLEKTTPSLRTFVNHFRWSFGVDKPHALLEAWRDFNIRDIAPKVKCPLLVLVGEGEYEQTDAKTMQSTLRFFSEVPYPIAVHEFKYTDGWAASHCSVGDEGSANEVIFDWLDRIVLNKESPARIGQPYEWDLLLKYKHNKEITELLKRLSARRI